MCSCGLDVCTLISTWQLKLDLCHPSSGSSLKPTSVSRSDSSSVLFIAQAKGLGVPLDFLSHLHAVHQEILLFPLYRLPRRRPGPWLPPSPSHHHLSPRQCHSHLPVSSCCPCHLQCVLPMLASECVSQNPFCPAQNPAVAPPWRQTRLGRGPMIPQHLSDCISSVCLPKLLTYLTSCTLLAQGLSSAHSLCLECTFHRFPQDCTTMPSEPLISDCNLHLLTASPQDHLNSLILLYCFPIPPSHTFIYVDVYYPYMALSGFLH